MGLKLLLGKYLSPKSSLKKADAIVVVSGGGDRVEHAMQLYNQRFAPFLILSGGEIDGKISDARIMQQKAIASKIPRKKILLEEKAKDTYENAMFVKKIVRRRKFKSLILVSSPYHQRRVYETFMEVLKDSGVTLQNSPSRFSRWRFYNWWKFKKGRKITLSELGKLLWIKLTGIYH